MWSFCETFRGKTSPAVSANSPGALLVMELPTEWLPASPASDGTNLDGSNLDGGFDFNVTLQYLTSWQGMGKARLACTGACACAATIIDAHVVAAASSNQRNVTIFAEHQFVARFSPPSRDGLSSVAGAETAIRTARNAVRHIGVNAATAPTDRCGVTLELLSATSSGGHLFRVRDVILFVAISPCDGEAIIFGGVNKKAGKDFVKIASRRGGVNCVERSSNA